MKQTILLAALAALLCGAPAVYAQAVDNRTPDQTVKDTIAHVMEAIRNEPAAAAGDPDRIDAIVQKDFLPSTDFLLTTQYAVGSAWDKATPAQRDALFREFQTLLARTYALQLTQMQGQDAQFRYGAPARPTAGGADAVVRTTVIACGDPVTIAYRLHRGSAGWKIYDIDMSGAWMIQVYRQQFAARLAAGGIDGLINYLAAHNRRP